MVSFFRQVDGIKSPRTPISNTYRLDIIIKSRVLSNLKKAANLPKSEYITWRLAGERQKLILETKKGRDSPKYSGTNTIITIQGAELVQEMPGYFGSSVYYQVTMDYSNWCEKGSSTS